MLWKLLPQLLVWIWMFNVSFSSECYAWRNSLVVQWLGLCALITKGWGSVPGLGTKIPQAEWHSQKKVRHEWKNWSTSINQDSLKSFPQLFNISMNDDDFNECVFCWSKQFWKLLVSQLQFLLLSSLFLSTFFNFFPLYPHISFCSYILLCSFYTWAII